MREITESLKKIRCLICDVDGVLTNGILTFDDKGNEYKSFNVQDGVGLKLLMAAGFEVAIITTSNTGIVDARVQQLGIKHYYKAQFDKYQAYESLKQTLQLQDENFAYIGDDFPDLPVIKQVGFGVAVVNAISMVREYANYQTQFSGGNGAVREICDLILDANDKLDEALKRYRIP